MPKTPCQYMLQIAMTLEEAELRLSQAEEELKTKDNSLAPGQESLEIANLLQTIYYLRGYIQGTKDSHRII